MDRFSLEFLSTRSTLWLALAPAFVALAVWVYYRTVAPLERPARTVLRILRAMAFLIVLFALAEPILTLVLPQPGKPGLAVLIDGSASMGLPASDPSLGSRADEAFSLALRVEEELSDDFRIDWFRFETGLRREQERPKPHFEGNTALGDVLEGIAARQGSRPVGGVMLLSDGANTVGADPVGTARTIGIPVYPVRVGAETAIGDAKILHVRSNPVAFSGEPTPLEVEIASSGFQGRTIELQVHDQGRILASVPVELGGGEEAEQSIRLDVRPVATGRRRFEIRLGGVDDAIPQNDLQSVAVEVLERKTRILVLEGRLDWDHTFLRRKLSADSTFAYRFLLCDREGRWMPERSGMRPPDGPGDLSDYAAVLLGEVPAGALGAGFYDRLARYLERGGGLFVIGGRSGLVRLRGTALAPLLPAEISGGAWGERPLPVRLEAAGITHPVTAWEDRPGRGDRVWSALPPVWPSPDRLRTRPQGVTLLSFEVPSGTEPALVVGYAGEGKVALLAAHDFWRWGFLPRGTVGAAPDVYGEVFLRLARWLAEPTMRDRFLAEPMRGVFRNGETPEFRARLWDDRYAPIADARVRLEISPADSGAGTSGTRSIELRPQGSDGNYAGRTEPLPPGTYRYVAEASAAEGQTLLGRHESIFWVDTNGSEFLRVRPDAGTLEQIARASGGEATDGAGLASILRRLPDVVQRVGRVREIELWNHIILFVSFVAVLSVEWFLRRRRGLA